MLPSAQAAAELSYSLNQAEILKTEVVGSWNRRISRNKGVHPWTPEHADMRVFQEWISLLTEAQAQGEPARRSMGLKLERYVVDGNMKSLSRIGTTLPLPGAPQADFDMSLLGCITLLGLFENDSLLVTHKTWLHLLREVTHLWGQEPKNYFDVLMLSFKETENHVFMIESTRYLTNQFIWENNRRLQSISDLRDSLLAHQVVLENREGTLHTLLLKQMHQIVKAGYFEFNAKVYQRFTLHALNNLYSFAADSTIRLGAQAVLDYTSAKFIFQSRQGIRLGPFRRNASKHLDTALFIDDAAASFFGIQSGQMPFAANQLGPFWDQQTAHASAALFSAVLAYRIPDLLLELAQSKKIFWGRMHTRHKFNGQWESTPESYFITPNFLSSSGGRYKFYRGANFPTHLGLRVRDNPWVYDIVSRSSSLNFRKPGPLHREIQADILQFEGSQWNFDNQTSYKNLVFGCARKDESPSNRYGLTREFYLSLPRPFHQFSNNNMDIGLYSLPRHGIYMILIKLKEPKSWWRYKYQDYYRSAVEVVDTAWVKSPEDLARQVEFRNSTSTRKYYYTLWSGERIWLNPKFRGKKRGIFSVETPKSPRMDSGEVVFTKAQLYGQNLSESELPLMIVHEISSKDLQPLGTVAYSDGEGQFFLENRSLKKRYLMDFSAWWHPKLRIEKLQDP